MARLKQKIKDIEWWEWACLLILFPIIVSFLLLWLLAAMFLVAVGVAADLLT